MEIHDQTHDDQTHEQTHEQHHTNTRSERQSCICDIGAKVLKHVPIMAAHVRFHYPHVEIMNVPNYLGTKRRPKKEQYAHRVQTIIFDNHDVGQNFE